VYVANPLSGIADVRIALGEPTRAIEPLRRALALREAAKHPEVAQTRFVLAKALWLADDRGAAREHLRILATGEGEQADWAKAWLADDRMP
jgi:thioredoxin-like negative regulator of GroEL